MSLPSKVKENSRLLDLSSDDSSEDLQLEIIPNRKRKITRKERNRNAAPKVSEPNIGQEVQCALCWAVRGTLLLWLLMLTWICASLYDQVTTMNMDIAKVSTSSGTVSDALQICHTTAKEMRANASELNARLSQLELEQQKLAERMDKAAKDLQQVSEQLSGAPNLADTPRRLADLQRTVADFGSQIKGFESALESTRKQTVAATSGVEEVKNLYHQLEGRTNDTIANVSTSFKKEDELKDQMTALNATIVDRIERLQAKIEEINKPVSTATPLTSSIAPSSTAPPVVATNVTSAPGPAKPFVLQ